MSTKQSDTLPKNLIKQYQTTAIDPMPATEALNQLRLLGLGAMIDSEKVLWINEICMGKYDSVYAQNKLHERLLDKERDQSSLIKKETD